MIIISVTVYRRSPYSFEKQIIIPADQVILKSVLKNTTEKEVSKMTGKDIHKATIIGAGFVGSTTAYTLMLSGLFSELVIYINELKVKGEVMDLNHGLPFAKPVKIVQGTYADCKDSDLIIITAGANQKEGETRLDLVQKNTEIFKSIVSNVVRYTTPDRTILLVVTNPVDILTYVTSKISGWPIGRVIGSGTVLDTARFRYLIGEHVGLDTRNIHGYILGEHGDKSFRPGVLQPLPACRWSNIALPANPVPREKTGLRYLRK